MCWLVFAYCVSEAFRPVCLNVIFSFPGKYSPVSPNAHAEVPRGRFVFWFVLSFITGKISLLETVLLNLNSW
jgi:hypothetical protein